MFFQLTPLTLRDRTPAGSRGAFAANKGEPLGCRSEGRGNGGEVARLILVCARISPESFTSWKLAFHVDGNPESLE